MSIYTVAGWLAGWVVVSFKEGKRESSGAVSWVYYILRWLSMSVALTLGWLLYESGGREASKQAGRQATRCSNKPISHCKLRVGSVRTRRRQVASSLKFTSKVNNLLCSKRI